MNKTQTRELLSVLSTEFDLLDFLLYNLILPTLACFAVGWVLAKIATGMRPYLSRWWQASWLRARYCALSKAQLMFAVAVLSNLLAAYLCVPLVLVPLGSGIKPMGLILFSLVANVVAFLVCRTVALDPERADGSKWLGGAAVLLCLTPFIGAMSLMHLIAWLRGLQFG